MLTYKYLGRRGRLGNQMFQYATLYSIAKTNNYSYGIPFNTQSEDDYRHMCLFDCFENISAEDCSNFTPISQIQEQTNLFIPEFMTVKDNVDIFGYFQTEKYFKQFKNELLKEFTFKKEIRDRVNKLKNTYNNELISIHMRFGDYDVLSHVYPKPTKEYYMEALEMLPNDAQIILFSDEPQKANSFFSTIGKKYISIPGMSKYEDMYFMSLCDYHIIANSSFSWWGSWLSNSKKTIAPKEWYGIAPGAPKEWHDVYCENWVVL